MSDESYKIRWYRDEEHYDFALVKRGMLIGAAPENDIRIPGTEVADVAAKIEYTDSRYIISGFKPETVVVNGRKKKKHALEPGDRFELAGKVFVFGQYDQSNDSSSKSRIATPVDDLTHFAELVAQERELDSLLKKIIDALLKTIGGTDAFIFKMDSSGNPQVFVSSNSSGDPSRFSDTIVQETIRRGTGIFIPNALADPSFSAARSIADLRLVSVLCCPITVAGKMSGVVYVGSKSAADSFGEEDLNILKAYSMIAGLLIDHVDYIGRQNETIRRLGHGSNHSGIIAESEQMIHLLQNLECYAASAISILIEGETGTGKDLIAQFIHKKSPRALKPLVVVNCSSLHGELLDSELFGHKKGSFTGAVSDHTGLFSAAEGGTLFLDEIGEMEIGLQAKLLRTIETGKVRPVGSTSEIDVDVRLVCATNRDLSQSVEDGSFRKDLYYRINQFRVGLPPLRDRGEDVTLLAYYFLEKYRAEYPSKDVVDFYPESLGLMASHDWPGNVRELANAVHKGVLAASGPLVRIEIPATEGQAHTFEQATREFQKRLLQNAIKATGGNKEQAARALGLSRSTFFRHLSSHGI